jgi:hypothetical protein
MDIESFSGAATVATACTLVFFVAARSWQLIARKLDPDPEYLGSMVPESAQRFRDELERLSHSLATYLGAALVFVLLFAAAKVLNAERIYSKYPDWQLYLLSAVLTIGAILAATKLVATWISRHRVKLLRDANVAIGHQLHRTLTGLGRLFHDVDTDAGIVDHVFVGRFGVFAVTVFARRAIHAGEVVVDGNELRFRPSRTVKSIVPVSKRVAALEREFRRSLDRRVRVQSVIAVPGWNITAEAAGDHILVNEHSLQVLQEWQNQSDTLSDDDVDTLQDRLTHVTTA